VPTYIGPFDVVQVDGKTYRRGDPINVSQTRLDQLRSYDGYRFDSDQAVNAVPITSNVGDPPHPPNEFGVPQDPNPKTNDAKAQAVAATPSVTSTP
jgi:hypothetical protein